jgi:hypothetical protein
MNHKKVQQHKIWKIINLDKNIIKTEKFKFLSLQVNADKRFIKRTKIFFNKIIFLFSFLSQKFYN